MLKISFVFPMYNEIGNIEAVVRGTHELASRVASEFEIIVVNDASTDGSGALADRLAGELPGVRVLHHPQNRGLGGALKTGFAAARMDHILYMDSDMPVSLENVEATLVDLDPLPDMLAGYRTGPAEGIYRRVQSGIYNRLLRIFFRLDVRDANFAFKLFRRDLLETPLRSEGSFIDAELLLAARARGYPITQKAFAYHPRTAGKSTIGGPGVVPQLLGDFFDCWFRLHFPKPAGLHAVIFSADDFGLSKEINAGVIESHEKGVVRSASIMVTGAAFEEAAAYVLEKKTLDAGLHLALCDGTPAADPALIPSLLDAGDAAANFPSGHAKFFKKYFSGGIDLADVEREFRAQLDKARAASLQISHLDSHHHLLALPPILALTIRLAKEYGIPVIRYPDGRDIDFISAVLEGRGMRALQHKGPPIFRRTGKRVLAESGVLCTDHFFGLLDVGRWNRKSFRSTLLALRPGVTEISCHPRTGEAHTQDYDWVYSHKDELDALTDESLLRLLHEKNVQLTSFRECFTK